MNKKISDYSYWEEHPDFSSGLIGLELSKSGPGPNSDTNTPNWEIAP